MGPVPFFICDLAWTKFWNVCKRQQVSLLSGSSFVKRGNLFNGTLSRDGFGFWGHAWSVIGLNRGRSQFLHFLGAPMILELKSVFLAVNASLCWMLAACNYSRFPCFLLVSRVWDILQVSALASHWLEDCANFTATPDENDQYDQSIWWDIPLNFLTFAHHLIVHYIKLHWSWWCSFVTSPTGGRGEVSESVTHWKPAKPVSVARPCVYAVARFDS
jgi:hypothetical protein